MKRRHYRVIGHESSRVVFESDDGVETFEQPTGTFTPCLSDHPLPGSPNPQRPGAILSTRWQPPPIVGKAPMKRLKGSTEVERSAFDRD